MWGTYVVMVTTSYHQSTQSLPRYEQRVIERQRTWFRRNRPRVRAPELIVLERCARLGSARGDSQPRPCKKEPLVPASCLFRSRVGDAPGLCWWQLAPPMCDDLVKQANLVPKGASSARVLWMVHTVSSPTHMRILMQKHVSSIDSVPEDAARAKTD